MIIYLLCNYYYYFFCLFFILTFLFYSYFRRWICFVGRSAYLAGGMNIVIKGVKASRKEAPLLVIAPHSTFLDSCISYVTGFPSIIARIEDALNPWVGSTCYQRNLKRENIKKKKKHITMEIEEPRVRKIFKSNFE